MSLLKFILILSFSEGIHMNSINNGSGHESVELVGWQFNELSEYFVISLFILTLLIFKIIHSNVIWIYRVFPESFVLLVVGGLTGFFIRYILKKNSFLDFNPNLFFYILLPPIILDASYALATTAFSRVIHFVLLFAILGTVFNFLIIGFLLYFINWLNIFGFPSINIPLKSLLLFSSLIVAVDPVAVLAIFADIGVDLDLYFIVFGESLLNDAVTVVVYDLMKVFVDLKSIGLTEYLFGIASFFTISLGGILVGVFFGIGCCLLTRIHTNSYEIMIMLLLGYLSYLFANALKWSGIISLVVCGLIQATYAFHNISQESLLSLRKIISIWSSMSEGLIFLFLGERIAHIFVGWHTGFALWSLLLCLLTRMLVVFCFSFLINSVNKNSGRKILFNEQLILIHGGLRGAVAFSLVMLIKSETIGGENTKNIFLCTTLFIIIFTVGIQGLTMKPMVKLLKIKTNDEDQKTLFYITNKFVVNNTTSVIKCILGDLAPNTFIKYLLTINDKIIKPILRKGSLTSDENLILNFNKLTTAFDSTPICLSKPPEIDYSIIRSSEVKIREPSTITIGDLNENIRHRREQNNAAKISMALSQDQYSNILMECQKVNMINARQSNNPTLLLNQLNEAYRIKRISAIHNTMGNNHSNKTSNVSINHSEYISL